MWKLLIVLAAATAQVTRAVPVQEIDREKAKIAAETLNLFAKSVLKLQDFENKMLSEIPVTSHLKTIFQELDKIESFRNTTVVSDLRSEVFDRLDEIQSSSSSHASCLEFFIDLVHDMAQQLDVAQASEVTSEVRELESLYNQLSEEMFDILMSVEGHIASTERQINDLISETNDEARVTRIRCTMDELDVIYKQGNKQLIEILTSVQTYSELAMSQLTDSIVTRDQ